MTIKLTESSSMYKLGEQGEIIEYSLEEFLKRVDVVALIERAAKKLAAKGLTDEEIRNMSQEDMLNDFQEAWGQVVDEWMVEGEAHRQSYIEESRQEPTVF